MQFGFSFDDTPAPTIIEMAYGTWNSRNFSHAQLVDALNTATIAVQSLAGPARPLFSKAIAQLQQEQQREQLRCGEDFSAESPCYFRGNVESIEAEALAAFRRHCESFAGTTSTSAGPVIEYKTKQSPRSKTFAMYVENVGSLILREYSGTLGHWNASLCFEPQRATFFLASYDDAAAIVEAPVKVWNESYCAHKLAEAKTHASVNPFAHNGREYIVTGITWSGSYAEATAWTFCRLEDWNGPTFTYAEHNKAADDGRTQRGDHRGTVILVRGRKCVIDGFAIFCDHRADLYKPEMRVQDDEPETFDSDDYYDDIEDEAEEEMFA